jgi:hemoglobin-like flavoprotein
MLRFFFFKNDAPKRIWLRDEFELFEESMDCRFGVAPAGVTATTRDGRGDAAGTTLFVSRTSSSSLGQHMEKKPLLQFILYYYIMQRFCCPRGIKTIHVTDHPSHSKYHIDHADPSEDDFRTATLSWYRILSRSAEGFLAAQEDHTISAEATPVVFFYDTFFEIWKTKSVFVLDQIYRNNIKLKSSSMIAMVSYLLKPHSDEEIVEMVRRHSGMGVTRSHYGLMAEVIIETVLRVSKKTDENDDVILCWRRIISKMVERIESVFRRSNRWSV